MFQDSVPAGSYNDPFLSSVCVRANVSTVVGCNWQPQFVNAPFWKDCEEDCVFFRAAKLF